MYISVRHFRNSLRYAFRGLAYAWKHEQNFRVQSVVAGIVLLAAIVLHLSALRAVVLVLLITLVLVLELLNTFFEKVVDLISPRLSPYAAVLKDVLAATVLMASIGSIIAGILLFWPSLSSVAG